MAHSTQFGGPWRSAARLKGCSVGAGVKPVAELLFQAKKAAQAKTSRRISHSRRGKINICKTREAILPLF